MESDLGAKVKKIENISWFDTRGRRKSSRCYTRLH